MLEAIVPEILHIILSNITNTKDLKSLSEVSLTIRAFILPRLYGKIILNHTYLDDLDFTIRHLPLHQLQKFTREVWIKGSSVKGCCHYMEETFPLPRGLENDGYITKNFCSVMNNLARVLETLPEDTLHSFRWDLGENTLDLLLKNVVAKHQSSLETLSLTMNCPARARAFGSFDLTPFKNIRSLTWKGIGKSAQFSSLADFFNMRSKGIKDLTLDFVNWPRADRLWKAQHPEKHPESLMNFFAAHVLGIRLDQRVTLFESLTALTLTAISFEFVESEIIYALNLINLNTLKLWRCPSSLALLDEMIKITSVPKLKSFSLYTDIIKSTRDMFREQHLVIAQFLNNFQGLEDLSLTLTLTKPEDWNIILADGILHHQSTLTRLNCHGRYCVPESRIILDGSIPWTDQRSILYRDTKLKYIGSSDTPSELQIGLQKDFVRPSCKVFHVRASGVDLESKCEAELTTWMNDADISMVHNGRHDMDSLALEFLEAYNDTPVDYIPSAGNWEQKAYRSYMIKSTQGFLSFARWAFSSDGLPDLQILAWGDYSNEGKFAVYNMLLCRNEDKSEYHGSDFRSLTATDTLYWELVDENIDMLSACSIDPALWCEEQY